jgi:hypothetical protein
MVPAQPTLQTYRTLPVREAARGTRTEVGWTRPGNRLMAPAYGMTPMARMRCVTEMVFLGGIPQMTGGVQSGLCGRSDSKASAFRQKWRFAANVERHAISQKGRLEVRCNAKN